ncbi:dsDNA nuclease domain-containing protein [Klebsiella aerogenes]|uniref:dsDNA nuclease domain-containing protein n=1 Tax=Klebsiella aerogenes TaxID=548 RepID=UPI000C77FAA6|nr:dsDNA nuclease domain-containing protein [Klebsiella aerogenes]
MAELHEVKPREQAGRDTLERYNAQIRAASIACLSILEGKDVKRVFCEFHDDFVIEKVVANDIHYTFVQVKTKEKLREIWKLRDVFGILKRKSVKNPQTNEMIRDSFVGKLLQHTTNFEDSCKEVVFLTNTHVDEDIENIINDISSETFSNTHCKLIIDSFNNCFISIQNEQKELGIDAIKHKLKKLRFETDVEYIKSKHETFEILAKEKIFKFSEIELSHSEAKEILFSLLALVNSKSSVKINDCSKENIEKLAGVDINDLLEVLSISKRAYYDFLENGDEHALKSASVIERLLRKAGASDIEVDFFTRCKIKWDQWLRNNRHIISELDYITLEREINSTLDKLTFMHGSLFISNLRTFIDELYDSLHKHNLLHSLDKETLIGSLFSRLVERSK